MRKSTVPTMAVLRVPDGFMAALPGNGPAAWGLAETGYSFAGEGRIGGRDDARGRAGGVQAGKDAGCLVMLKSWLGAGARQPGCGTGCGNGCGCSPTLPPC